jgi:endonuclease YncB( thermonuclease family)
MSGIKPPTAADTSRNSYKEAKKPSNASNEIQSSNKPNIAQKQSESTANVTKKYVKGMVLSGHADVWDGHSLVVDGHPVRLNGIEAPGLAQMCNTASMTVWPCGAKASQRLIQLINGDNVSCRVMDQAGHGAAAVCSTRSIGDLGEMLVSEGLALPNSFGSKYGVTAQSAKKARKGLFIGSFIHPSRWRLQNPS